MVNAKKSLFAAIVIALAMQMGSAHAFPTNALGQDTTAPLGRGTSSLMYSPAPVPWYEWRENKDETISLPWHVRRWRPRDISCAQVINFEWQPNFSGKEWSAIAEKARQSSDIAKAFDSDMSETQLNLWLLNQLYTDPKDIAYRMFSLAEEQAKFAQALEIAADPESNRSFYFSLLPTRWKIEPATSKKMIDAVRANAKEAQAEFIRLASRLENRIGTADEDDIYLLKFCAGALLREHGKFEEAKAVLSGVAKDVDTALSSGRIVGTEAKNLKQLRPILRAEMELVDQGESATLTLDRMLYPDVAIACEPGNKIKLSLIDRKYCDSLKNPEALMEAEAKLYSEKLSKIANACSAAAIDGKELDANDQKVCASSAVQSEIKRSEARQAKRKFELQVDNAVNEIAPYCFIAELKAEALQGAAKQACANKDVQRALRAMAREHRISRDSDLLSSVVSRAYPEEWAGPQKYIIEGAKKLPDGPGPVYDRAGRECFEAKAWRALYARDGKLEISKEEAARYASPAQDAYIAEIQNWRRLGGFLVGPGLEKIGYFPPQAPGPSPGKPASAREVILRLHSSRAYDGWLEDGDPPPSDPTGMCEANPGPA